jgi:hypothetical protein
MEKPTDLEPDDLEPDEEIVPAAPRPRRRWGLKAGPDAETDFVIVRTGGGDRDRVRARFTMPDPCAPRR